MCRAWALKDLVRVWWFGVAGMLGVLGWAGAAVEQEEAESLLGVVVENVGEGSALEKAGIRPGDVLLEWERLPNPPANPVGVHGVIRSIFDWEWIEVEQAPRGPIWLTGEHDGEVKIFKVPEGRWNMTVRARMSGEVLAEYSRGRQLIEAGEISAGIEHWYQVARIAKNQAMDESLRCYMLLHIGDVWRKAQQLEKAHSAYNSALETTQRPLARVAIWQKIGNSYERAGEFESSLAAYDSALDIIRNNWGESLMFARGLHYLARWNLQQSHLEVARSHLQHALKIRQELAPGSLEEASSRNNLGILASIRGDLDRAADHYETSLEIMRKLAPGSLDVASTLNNLGLLASDRNDLDRAIECHEEALEIYQKLTPDGRGVASSLSNLGLLASDRGDLDRATEYHGRALEIYQNLEPRGLDVASRLHSLGGLAYSRGNLDLAIDYYDRALAIQQKMAPGSSAEADILYDLAIVRRKQGQPRLSLDLILQSQQALEKQLARIGGSRDVQAIFRAKRVLYYHDAISLALELQQPDQAFYTLERSRAQSFLAQLAENDLIVSDIPEDLEHQRLRNRRNSDQKQNEIARLNQKDDAKEIKETKSELRQLDWDYEDITEKIIKTSPKLGALRYPQPLNLKAAHQTLDSGTVMLSYSVAETQTFLFILDRDEDLQVKTLDIKAEELREDVEKILKLQKRSTGAYMEPFLQAGQRLYQTLIQPAEESIAKSERVLIIPDGPLHLLPFALLPRKIGPEKDQGDRNVEYLVEWKPLHSVLSATVYAELKNRRRSKADPNTGALALAAFGDPAYPQENRDFSPLRYSREEINRITALFPEGSARAFLGIEASEQRVKSIAKGARILHFATHGVFDSQTPFHSHLALTIPTIFQRDQDNGLLQVREIFESVRLDADLVVLSACQSGLGDEVATEGLIGLTRAFQFAGARTVMSTLWQVDDQATAELMVRFYQHLKEGLPKDKALRAAQRELISGPVKVETRQGRMIERDFKMPYYWAAFQVIGDWR